MPSREDCENEIVAASNGMLTRDDAKRLLNRFADRMARSADDPITMARQIGDEATASAIIEKRNRLMNLRKRIAGTELAERQIPDLRARHGKEGIFLALRSKIEGINTVVESGRVSAEAIGNEQANLYRSRLLGELDKLGTFNAFRNSATFQDQVGRELYELSMASVGQPHQIGITGDKLAMQTAEAINKWQSYAKEKLNQEGAWIGDYAGYISRTTHDPYKLHQAGFEEWRNYILTKLNYDRVFEGIDNPEQYLHNVYDNLWTGIHIPDGSRIGLKDPAFKGPANIAKSLSQSRELHFKDADAWLDYQKRFGTGTLADQVWRSLDRSGRDFGLMRVFGTNPRAELEGYIDRFIDRYQYDDPAGAKYLRDNRGTLDKMMGYLDGRLDHPVNSQLARISQGLRNIESAGKLSAVVFTHLFSMATKISLLRYDGVPWGEAVANAITSLGVGAKGRFGHEELHDLLLSNLDGHASSIMQRWTPGEQRPGLTSSILATVLRWEGLNYVINAEKAGTKDMLARQLGRQVDRTFDELIPQSQRALTQYGISRSDWELLRNAPDHTKVSDRVYLTPDAAHRVEPQLDANGNDLFTSKLRDDLAMKLYSYYEDRANQSIVTPGISEKTFFYRGTENGSPAGEVLRMLAQFKMWGAANIRQNIGREWYGNPGSGTWLLPSKSQAMGLASLAVMSTLLGYARMVTVGAMKGELPRDPTSPKTIEAAMLQGGGFGILGDFLFGQWGRTGQGLGETLLGPTIGTGLQLAEIYGHLKAAAEGDTHTARKDLPPELLKVTLDNTPFINMFYLRTALNYAFLWRFQEWLNPGFQRRRERRIQQETGQRFWLSPAQSVR
jgi:hypothetical protein